MKFFQVRLVNVFLALHSIYLAFSAKDFVVANQPPTLDAGSQLPLAGNFPFIFKRYPETPIMFPLRIVNDVGKRLAAYRHRALQRMGDNLDQSIFEVEEPVAHALEAFTSSEDPKPLRSVSAKPSNVFRIAGVRTNGYQLSEEHDPSSRLMPGTHLNPIVSNSIPIQKSRISNIRDIFLRQILPVDENAMM